MFRVGDKVVFKNDSSVDEKWRGVSGIVKNIDRKISFNNIAIILLDDVAYHRKKGEEIRTVSYLLEPYISGDKNEEL